MSATPPRATRAFVFLGAFLLFALEPLCGRLLVARFGGAFYVWTSALMFFQAALVVGYLYAHRLAPRLGRWHLAVIAAALLLLPPRVGPAPAEADPWDLLRALLAPAGLAAVVLSATSVAAQRSLAGRLEDRALYALYALSNVGSLAALGADALGLAPWVGLRAQSMLWSVLFVVYALVGAVALRDLRPVTEPLPAPSTWRERLGWTALPACTAAALSGVTNQLTLDAGQLPLLWTLPLALYLLSFVVAFARVARVPPWVPPLAPSVAAVGLWLCAGGDTGSPALQGLLHLTVFAWITLAAHTVLYAVRPEPTRLGSFYLCLALGGALGGAFVALLAPRLFTGLFELPIALVGAVLVMGALQRHALGTWLRAAPRPEVLVRAAVPVLVLGRLLLGARDAGGVRELAATRSPYGLYRVFARGPVRELSSGTTRHGRQRDGSREPASYYHREGPLGEVVAALARPRGTRRFGIVGLGVGATTAYLEPGDTAVVFEIDPAVVDLARAHFRYLREARGDLRVVTGDARTALAARRDTFDLLLVDAFAGDAIPAHLVTREAVSIALRRSAIDGVVVFHVSNRLYDLRPVLAAIARDLRLALRWKERLDGLAPDEDPSRYVVLARDPRSLDSLTARGWKGPEGLPTIPPWTDDHADPLGLWLRLR